MLPLAVPVVATLADPGAAKNLRGVGTVEKKIDDATYIIGTAKGRVTVTTLDGTLEVNSTVAISRQGNRLTIQPYTSEAQEQSPASDSYAGAAPAKSGSSGDAGSPPAPAIKIDKEEPEGFVRFGSARDAARWLESQGAAPAQTAKAVSGAAPGQPVVVYTYRAADGTSNAVVLDDASAAAELQHVAAAELKSPVWQQLAGQALEDVLQARGSVTVDQLVAVDQALTAAGGPVSPPDTLPDQTGRLQQWLTVVLDARNAMDSAASLPPLSGAADVAALYEQIVDGSDTAVQNILPGLTQETLTAPASAASTAVPDTVELLGLNFERQLLGADPDTAFAGSVKGQLYRILADTEPVQAAGVPAAQSSQTTQLQAALEQFGLAPRDIAAVGASFERTASAAPLQSASPRSELVGRLNAALSSVGRLAVSLAAGSTTSSAPATVQVNRIVQSLTEEISAVTARPTATPIPAGSQPSTAGDGAPSVPDELIALRNSAGALMQWADALPASPASPDVSAPGNVPASTESEPPQSAATTMALTDFARKIEQAVGRIIQEAAGFNRTAATDVPEAPDESEALVRSVQESLRTLSETIAGRADALLQRVDPQPGSAGSAATVPQKQIDSLVGTFAKETLELVQNTVRSIQNRIQQLPDDATPAPASKSSQAVTRVVQEIRDLETLVEGAGKRAGQPGAADSSSLLTADHVRQQVETALSRIESLQVLARPAQTSEGQQQVLALPMRIDGEWKEVTIRLLRRHSGKGAEKRTKRGYGVQIAVSPAAAGDIAIAMDYRPGVPLNVHMNFALPQSRRWFEGNRTLLATALQNVGFSAVTLQFGTLTDKKQAGDGARGASEGGSGKIDIKV